MSKVDQLAQITINQIRSKRAFTQPIKEGNLGRFIAGSFNIFTGSSINDFQNQFQSISSTISLNKFDSIGSWKDEESGLIYIDASHHYSNLEEALEAAKANGEIAIFDLETPGTIYIK